jgi:hypothetical protein
MVLGVFFAGFAVAQEQTVEQVIARVNQGIDASTLASQALKDYAKKNLVPLCTNEVFVREAEAQNAKKVTLEDIKKADQEWINAEDELPVHKEKLGNACAQEIAKVAAKLPALGEVFVMDNQGANVGQNVLTSDYWQGDEEKWTNAFNEGKGGVDISESKLDKSTNTIDQKISLPLVNPKGIVVGAICIGVKTDQL